MGDDATKPVETSKPATSELKFQFPSSYAFPSLFQIFFLSPDQNQNVEILETGEIDFEEIIERLNAGESVFIKNKNQTLLESCPKMNKTDEKNLGYFTHY